MHFDMQVTSLIAIFFMAVVMEIIDSGLGMMYGTLLAPFLILMGYNPKLVVPSIVLSQAVGGTVGTIGHNARRNSNFRGLTKDLKISLSIIVPGMLAAVAGVYCGKWIPTFAMKTYIGILVLIMGLLCVRPIYFAFSWSKMYVIGLISGFNKAFSGGGFGPVTSTAKILAGVDPKVSVGTTTLAEAPICFLSFILWFFLGGHLDWRMPVTLCCGALIGGCIGPWVTQRLNTRMLKIAVGVLALASGAWLLIDLYLRLGLGQ